MKIYGYTSVGGAKFAYDTEVLRDGYAKRSEGSTSWEYEVPDHITALKSDADLPTEFGTLIRATFTNGDELVLCRLGSESFPWVGMTPDRDAADAWASRAITSWTPYHRSGATVADYFFKNYGMVLEDEDGEEISRYVRGVS